MTENVQMSFFQNPAWIQMPNALNYPKNGIKTDKSKTISSSLRSAERHEICALCYY